MLRCVGTCAHMTVETNYGGMPVNIYGAACANLLRTFHEVPPTNFSNTAVDSNTRLDRLQGAFSSATSGSTATDLTAIVFLIVRDFLL